MVIEWGYTGDPKPRDLAARRHRSDTTDSIGAIPSKATYTSGDCTISSSLYVHRKSVTRRFPWDFLAIISLQRRFQVQGFARRFPVR